MQVNPVNRCDGDARLTGLTWLTGLTDARVLKSVCTSVAGTPPVRRGTSTSPFSELREPILIIFYFLKSSEVDFFDFVFFVVFSL